MSNPLRILRTLDKNLQLKGELTLFGRAALALGFADAPERFHSTLDVDGILPISWLEATKEQENFWQAVQLTNAELESDGLYLTHLFREIDVIIQPDWITRRVRLDLSLSRLAIFRPAAIDLILTKMARGDEDDLDDIRFLIKQEQVTVAQLTVAFERARVPNIREIRDLFERAKSNVLALQ